MSTTSKKSNNPVDLPRVKPRTVTRQPVRQSGRKTRAELPRLYKGFTLVELVIVLAIVVVLSGLLYFTADPYRRLAEVRDDERRATANAMLGALLRYALDSNGRFSPELENAKPDSVFVLGTAQSGCESACGSIEAAGNCLDLSASLVGTYLGAMPVDPLRGTTEQTGYYVKKSVDRRLTIGACFPERVDGISIMR